MARASTLPKRSSAFRGKGDLRLTLITTDSYFSSGIRRCRDFGFVIEKVRELVGLMDEPERPCVDVRDVAARHLSQLRSKLAELQALERAMTAFVGSCDSACAGGAAVDCTILEDLAAPAEDAKLLANPGCCAAG